MKQHKFISAILHPIVMPTIGIFLYFLLTPFRIQNHQKLTIITIIFVTTYLVPLLLLVLLKSIGYLKSYSVFSIRERKMPVFFMIILLFSLAELFKKLSFMKDLSYLFYGTVLSLILTYILLYFKFKSSIHLLSVGATVGFFIIFQQMSNVNTIPLVISFIFLSGLLGTSRLFLNAHTPKEVYTGFFIGFCCQFLAFYLL